MHVEQMKEDFHLFVAYLIIKNQSNIKASLVHIENF